MLQVTSECILRPWEKEDAPGLYAIANNPKIAANLRDAFPSPYIYQNAVDYISMAMSQTENPALFAIVINNKIAGSLGMHAKTDVQRFSVEMGYFLAEEHWGKGIMTKCVKTACHYTFENFPVIRIYTEVFATNHASRKVMEKSGFRLEGVLRKAVYKNGQFLDCCMYGLLKESEQ